MSGITGMAFLAALLMIVLLIWMLKDLVGAKEQIFKQDEWGSLDLLRREIYFMESAIAEHLEIVEKARQGFTNTECEAVRKVYVQVAADLAQITYDRSVFVDKGITRPGQCCYNIYKRLSADEVPLGFAETSIAPQIWEKIGTPEQNALEGPLMMPVDEKVLELRGLKDKFCNARKRLFKRLEIYARK